MPFIQGDIVSWDDLRGLYDKVNAERARLLSQTTPTAPPAEDSLVLPATPAQLRTLISGIISGNTFARTDLASTLTAVNNLANPSTGNLLQVNPMGALDDYMDIIEGYDPHIRQGTMFSNYFAVFFAAHGIGFTNFVSQGGTFHSAFGTSFNGFSPASGTYHGAFGTRNTTFHGTYYGTNFGTYFATFCSGFFYGSNGHSEYCGRFRFSSRFGRTHRDSGFHASRFHSGFHSGYFSAFGTGNTSFVAARGTFFNTFGTGCTGGFVAGGGTTHNAFAPVVTTRFDNYCPSFNGSFCPAEFCTSFNAASFFNTLEY